MITFRSENPHLAKAKPARSGRRAPVFMPRVIKKILLLGSKTKIPKSSYAKFFRGWTDEFLERTVADRF